MTLGLLLLMISAVICAINLVDAAFDKNASAFFGWLTAIWFVLWVVVLKEAAA